MKLPTLSPDRFYGLWLLGMEGYIGVSLEYERLAISFDGVKRNQVDFFGALI